MGTDRTPWYGHEESESEETEARGWVLSFQGLGSIMRASLPTAIFRSELLATFI